MRLISRALPWRSCSAPSQASKASDLSSVFPARVYPKIYGQRARGQSHKHLTVQRVRERPRRGEGAAPTGETPHWINRVSSADTQCTQSLSECTNTQRGPSQLQTSSRIRAWTHFHPGTAGVSSSSCRGCQGMQTPDGSWTQSPTYWSGIRSSTEPSGPRATTMATAVLACPDRLSRRKPSEEARHDRQR